MKKYFLFFLLFTGLWASGQQNQSRRLFAMMGNTAPEDTPYTFVDTDAADYISRVEGHGVDVRYYQKAAFDNFFSGSKTDTLWTGPFRYGGYLGWNNSSANAEPFKSTNPDIVWSGNFTILPGRLGGNGGYGNLGFAPSAMTVNNTSLSLYVYEGSTASSARDMGANGPNQGTSSLMLITNFSNNFYSDHYTNSTTNGRMQLATTTTKGFYMASRTSSTLVTGYVNGTSIGTSTATNTGTLPTVNMYLYTNNNNGTTAGVSPRYLSLWFAGDGATATQAANANSRVEALMDALGHGVQ